MKQRGTVGEYIDGCVHVYLPTCPKPKAGTKRQYPCSGKFSQNYKIKRNLYLPICPKPKVGQNYGILALTKYGQNYQIKRNKNIVKEWDGSKV